MLLEKPKPGRRPVTKVSSDTIRIAGGLPGSKYEISLMTNPLRLVLTPSESEHARSVYGKGRPEGVLWLPTAIKDLVPRGEYTCQIVDGAHVLQPKEHEDVH